MEMQSGFPAEEQQMSGVIEGGEIATVPPCFPITLTAISLKTTRCA
jgi:hypothetical protein